MTTDQATIDTLREQKAALEADIATLPEKEIKAIKEYKDKIYALVKKGGPTALAALSLAATEIAEASYEILHGEDSE